MNTLDLIAYYANLLILQYVGKPKAYGTIETVVTPIVMPQVSTQTITFDPIPTSGTFTLFYDVDETSAINWNDSASAIESKLQAITALASVTVSGSIASGVLTVTFTGVTPPAELLVLGSNSLSPATIPFIEETDVTLPIAVQNAFNVTGPNPAVGVQLDVLGKYAGVSRTVQGFTQQITLDDADFTSLIKLATVENSAGSSDAEIVGILNNFFPQQVFLFDNQRMEFDYYISTTVGSQDFIQAAIVEDLLPRPMGVRIKAIIYFPVINMFFGFRTYEAPAYNVTPFNSYSDYQMDWPWLSYQMAIII